MSLNEYRAKRNPARTPEPFTPGTKRGKKPSFVVQRHEARSLHYDLRLERHGALASWAVPKGVPLEPGGKALAVHVEDHPLSYGQFHGEIPKGEYGAGRVEIWDSGTYELLEEKANGQLTFALSGKRLQGTWTLVPAHLDGKEQNWLLIRAGDDAGRTTPRRAYRPMLATAHDGVPGGPDWAFEVKFDGYRTIAYLRNGECRLVSRNDNDLTERFAEVARQVVAAVKSPDAVVDGEVCRLDPTGRSSFSELQQGSGALVLYAFDLLELDGEPLIDLPLTERKRRLKELLDPGNRVVRFSDSFGDGPALLAAAAERGLEGVVAKRPASRYTPGKRSREWLKVKLNNDQEFIVAGYTRGTGQRAGTFGALILGEIEEGRLRYVGSVGTGFGDAEIARLLKLLKPLARSTPPFSEVPKLPRTRASDVHWVEPRLAVQVRFSEWTHDRHLRHPSYLGLRDDKLAREVTSDEPIPSVLRRGKRELRLSNLDKPFWPELGITKGDLLQYYRDIAPVLVPHLKDRPFTMRRYPDGAGGKAFFQKNAPAHMPEWLPTFHTLVTSRDEARTRQWIDLPVVNDELGLLWMANMGCIDMNTWYSRIDRPDRPDFVLFDLDPTPDTPWESTIQVARILGELLDQLGLASFPKTSGGKGFHVLVPLDRRSTYDDTRNFAELVAGAIARTHPKLATTEWSKSRRRGVLIDANQNGQGKTIASAYSVRPNPRATVSTPLTWDEVGDGVDPNAFTMASVLERVEALGDLHAGLRATRQSLSRALAQLG